MKIQVMGPGCSKCEQVEKIVKEAVAESGVDAEVIKVSDFKEIASFGVFSTPAVAVDGEVKVMGKVPSKKDVISWIK
ncbi:thioredoxin family protein [Maridesulfovibrio zosterae]|uniref:thioredoxin family protein n=1 Tax=Maridesulfovibrio zosterae TaxID=82171 RepID=UPI0004028294|nr:thioredoxin family protein [Maridesulfovibrio zosterae]